jgi:hypothetical protein
MQAWSNGELHNAKHGVLCVAAAPRFTVGRGHVPVGAPGRRRGARARGAHGRAAPAPVQGVQLRRVPAGSALHPGASGEALTQFSI